VLKNQKALTNKKKLIGARQKTSTPFPLDLKQEKVNLFRPKKGHFAENFSFAFDIFEACLIFERLNISRSPKATS
jgi:hypothetical protein